MQAALKINEIFYSIQGEGLSQGRPTTFVRTSGCNLRCKWCDTRYAFWEGRRMEISQITKEVEKNPTRYVCLTGGEPLGQKAIYPLMEQLLQKNYAVSLETGGGFSVKEVPKSVTKVMDLKCPDSGESGNMIWENLDYLTPEDQIKFVIASRKDFDWALETIDENELSDLCPILFTPVFGSVKESDLADWVLQSGSKAILQLQLHKSLWGEAPGR